MTKLQLIDEFDKAKHRRHLDAIDRCYYYFTYNGKSDLIRNSPRSIIKNLKRSPSELKTNSAFVHFKNTEITNLSNLIYRTLIDQPEFLNYVWIPIAPSKERNDPEYDDRLIKILSLIKAKLPCFRFSEIISTKTSTDPSHQTNNRDINEKIKNLILDQSLLSLVQNERIMLFDDMITSGATYTAYKQFLIKNNIREIEGFFICKAINDLQVAFVE